MTRTVLQGKRVLITGASGGIGSAVARRFAEEGAHLALHYFRSREKAGRLAHECLAHQGIVTLIQADLSTAEGLSCLKASLEEQRFFPDILVNNAGCALYGLVQDVTEAAWETMINLHLRSSFFLSQWVLPHMIQQRCGRIINISSIWGRDGAANEVLYSTVKGGLNTMTRALAKEVASSGTTVNAIAPGLVKTEMARAFDSREWQEMLTQIPAARAASPLEVAEIVVFLSTPQAAYINGQVIGVDGGWL